MKPSDIPIGRRTAIRSVGGAAVAAATGGIAAAQDDGEATIQPDWGDWFTATARGDAADNYTGQTLDLRGRDEVTITVGAAGNGGNFGFAPVAVWVDPGTTIRWQWNGKGGGHNVVSESGPADLDSGDPVTEAGVHYEHTFEETGINTYYCVPHLAVGMKGGVAVGDDIPTVQATAGGAGDGGGRPLPGGDIGVAFIALILGSAGFAALAVLAGEAYGAIRRGAEAAGAVEEAAPFQPAHAIGHEEFDPTGTASLIAIYFLILLVLWLFMYFVEFLGNGPTVIG